MRRVPQEAVLRTEFPFRTPGACFLHRVSLKTHRVHQEAFFSTECIFRTPGGPLRYRILHRQKGERPCLRANFSNCRKRKGQRKKRSPERRREQENHSQKVCNATQRYSVPLGKASMPQSYSMPPESPTLHRYLNQESRSAN